MYFMNSEDDPKDDLMVWWEVVEHFFKESVDLLVSIVVWVNVCDKGNEMQIIIFIRMPMAEEWGLWVVVGVAFPTRTGSHWTSVPLGVWWLGLKRTGEWTPTSCLAIPLFPWFPKSKKEWVLVSKNYSKNQNLNYHSHSNLSIKY